MELAPTVPLPRRWLHPTSRSDVQVTWHNERDRVVISLWRDGVCVGTAPLTIGDVASLTGFLVEHLGAKAAQTTGDPATE